MNTQIHNNTTGLPLPIIRSIVEECKHCVRVKNKLIGNK